MAKLNDRSFFLDLTDAPLRMRGAAWPEQHGGFYVWDDFIGTGAVAASIWTATDTVAAGAGKVTFVQSASAGAPVAGHGGWLRGTTSDNAGGAEEIGTGAIFRPSRVGNRVLAFQTRISLPSVTAVNMSCGLTNANTYGDGTAMNISGTTVLVTTATNGACWLFDTRSTDPDVFVGVSVDNNVDSAANSTLGAQGTASTPGAGKSYVLRIELDSAGNSFFYQGAEDLPDSLPALSPGNVAQGRQAAAGTTLKDTLLAAYVGIDNAGAGANKSLDIDYIFAGCAR